MSKSFGPHIMLEFFTSCDPQRLNDQVWWRGFLIRLVAHIKMTVLWGPVVGDSSCSNPEWDPPDQTGLSGVIVLSESHVFFHSLVESEYVFLDIFSCKDYDIPKMLEFVADELGAYRLDSQLTIRGSNFPFRKSGGGHELGPVIG